jgi:hypothetical protein
MWRIQSPRSGNNSTRIQAPDTESGSATLEIGMSYGTFTSGSKEISHINPKSVLGSSCGIRKRQLHLISNITGTGSATLPKSKNWKEKTDSYRKENAQKKAQRFRHIDYTDTGIDQKK